MTRRIRAYTEVGERIATLGGRQWKIARVLGVSQQTVSKKLRGETAILLSNLEALARHFKVPLTYFFDERSGEPRLTRAIEKAKSTPGPLRDLLVRLASMPRASIQKTLKFTETLTGSR